MWPDQQISVDLVTFTEKKYIMENHLLCSDCLWKAGRYKKRKMWKDPLLRSNSNTWTGTKNNLQVNEDTSSILN